MGDNLLMKILFNFLFVFLTSIVAQESDDLSWVNEQIEAIKPPRVGIKNQFVSRVRDPFIFLEKNKTKKEEKEPVLVPSDIKTTASSSIQVAAPKIDDSSSQQTSYTGKFLLSAIMNQSVFINGKWYKKGERINGYLISEIGTSSVILKRNSKSIVLSTDSQINSLKFKK